MNEKEQSSIRQGETMKLATANGTISNDEIADSECTTLPEVPVTDGRVLNKTPRVLAVHKLILEGCEFTWNSGGGRS